MQLRATSAISLLLLVLFTASTLYAEEKSMPASPYEIATFAGGCFWCMEPAFDMIPGVTSTIVGYTGGHVKNPTYEQIGTGTTGHVEAIQVTFDPTKVDYKRIIKEYWENIDPTQEDGQFADRGSQYHTAIFYHSDDQKRIAEETKATIEKSGIFKKPIATKILPASEFYPAEEYHQEYYKKNTWHYNMYKHGSGRADFIERTWKKH